jgi:hypothetical protein
MYFSMDETPQTATSRKNSTVERTDKTRLEGSMMGNYSELDCTVVYRWMGANVGSGIETARVAQVT